MKASDIIILIRESKDYNTIWSNQFLSIVSTNLSKKGNFIMDSINCAFSTISIGESFFDPESGDYYHKITNRTALLENGDLFDCTEPVEFSLYDVVEPVQND